MRARLTPAVLLLALGAAPAAGQRAPGLSAFGTDAALRTFVDSLRAERDRTRAAQGAAAVPAPCPGAQAVVRRHVRGAGDSARVEGMVRTAAGGIASAQVTVEGTSLGAITDSAGAYRLLIPAAAAADSVTLRAQALGFHGHAHRVPLAAGDTLALDFVLCAAQVSVQALTVTAAAPSITNVQHAGVDEGGIVKRLGEHLVILRRGRLFTVRIGGGALAAVDAIDAFGPGIDPEHAWYDELLVSGSDVVVIGYNYQSAGTELGIFRMDARGRLRHRATWHLTSEDYYASRNYASRLVEGRLVLYAPHSLELDEDPLAQLPGLGRWRGEPASSAFRRVLPPTRIYRPASALGSGPVVLHTVTTCDLAAPALTCEATALLGSWSRVSYVSPHAVYVWVSDPGASGAADADAVLYRIAHADGHASALRVRGTPVDHFSFLERDGFLNVLVRSWGFGEGMWAAEWRGGALRLLRIATDALADGRAAAPADAYRRVPQPQPQGTLQNRFVGEHVLYGTGAGWGRPLEGGAHVYAVRYTDGASAALPLPHGVDRIEALGSDAVVIGARGPDLHFSGIDLDALPRVVQHRVRPDAAQGELRSHGFFYRADGRDRGLLALPVRAGGAPGGSHLLEGSAAIVFLRNDGRAFHPAGELTARPGRDVRDEADGCRASCVDWYGNARPIFTEGRTFALLGYELVEGALRGGHMRELRRIDFTPRAVRPAGR